MTPHSLKENRIRILICLCAFVFAVGAMLAHRPWSQMEVGDEAIWDYIAQSIVRGQVPYRDVVEIKTPLSAYLGALAIVGGKLVGMRDVMGIRAMQVGLVGLLSAITFLVGEEYLRDRSAALVGFLVPLGFWHFAEWMVAGTEPKLSMILFGMLALLLFARDRTFSAGVCSMLSCLCWQPGLLFTGAIFLVASRYFTKWRDGRALQVIAGAMLPLVILLAYFYSIGALGDLWDWTIRYNYNVYAYESMKASSLIHVWRVLNRVLSAGIVILALSVAGFVMFAAERIRDRFRIKTEPPGDSFRDALLISVAVYFLFCLINFQSGPDLIPLFPFIGLFAGWFFVRVFGLLMKRPKFSGKAIVRSAPDILPRLAFLTVALLVFYRSLAFRFEHQSDIQDQERAFAVVADRLATGDKIYVHGTVELLVLLNRANLNPYIFLDRGKDDYVARKSEEAFRSVVDQIESMSPKVVALSRLAKVAHRADLEDLVRVGYEKLEVPGYDGIYVHNDDR